MGLIVGTKQEIVKTIKACFMDHAKPIRAKGFYFISFLELASSTKLASRPYNHKSYVFSFFS